MYQNIYCIMVEKRKLFLTLLKEILNVLPHKTILELFF